MKGYQDLKNLFQDDRLHIYLGIVKRLHLAKDRSYLKLDVSVLPENRKIVATMTWENVGPDSGEFEFPAPGDLVLLANSEGNDDDAFVIKRLSSREDKIPQAAADGDKVSRARSGNRYWNVSDSAVFLARGDDEPTENLVLGQVFKEFAQVLLEILKEHAQNDAEHRHLLFGYLTRVPVNEGDYLQRKEEYDTIKEDPIDNEAILSDLSFTEK